MKVMLRKLVGVLMLILCACAYTKQVNIREEFDQSMKGYNKMLR